MNFNPDTSKQAQEVIFSRKIKVTAHPHLVFNSNPVHETATQMHLGMFLDINLQNALLKPSLLTIYKSFIRPHLDYGDIIYDQCSPRHYRSYTWNI